MIHYYLYRHWDAEGRLLYVGRTHDLHTRHLTHRSSSPWFGEIAEITIQAFDSRWEAAKAERVAIHTENPLHNQRGKPEQPSEEPEADLGQPRTFWLQLGASSKSIGGKF